MNNQELLDNFLNRSLNAEQRIALDEAINKDLDFKNEYHTYYDLIKGIRLYGSRSIAAEVNAIHKEIIPSVLASIAFEADVTIALQLKQKQSIKNEILEIRKSMPSSSEFTVQNTLPSEPIKTVSMWNFRALAIAASTLVLIVAGILWIKKDTTQQVIWAEAMAQSFEAIELDAQQVGLADPNQPSRQHHQFIFNLLTQNKIDSAKIANDKYYSVQNKDSEYYLLEGWIHFISKNNTKAMQSFERAMESGDPCLSKLLYAFMKGKDDPDSKKQIEQVKQNEVCQSSDLIKVLIQKMAL